MEETGVFKVPLQGGTPVRLITLQSGTLVYGIHIDLESQYVVSPLVTSIFSP